MMSFGLAHFAFAEIVVAAVVAPKSAVLGTGFVVRPKELQMH